MNVVRVEVKTKGGYFMKRIELLLVSSLVIAALLNSNAVCYADAQPVQMFEITEIGHIDTAGLATSIQIQNDIAYVSAGDSGLYVINITDPENPTELNRYNESIVDIHDIYVNGNLVYIADYTAGLKIVDISNVENLTLMGEFNDGGEVGALEICGNLAFLADFEDGLEIVNATDSMHPQELVQYDTNINDIYNIEVNNDLAYVSNFISASERVLIILNISDISSIEEIARYTIDGEIFSIDFIGDIAYMMCSTGGVKIYNISDTNALVEIGSYYDGGNAVNSEFFEDYMVVADWSIGLEVLNVRDPSSIVKVGYYFDGGNASDIEIVNNIIFVADGEDGLEILRIAIADESTNPFFIGLIVVSASAIVVLGIVVIVRYRK
jgi:hypothetical protein